MTPLTFLLKTLIQQLWINGFNWNDILPYQIVSAWNKFLNELSHIQQHNISRQVIPNGFLSCCLHGFYDACEFGYANVVYLRYTHHDDSLSVHILSNPVKKFSSPHLELCGTLLLSKLMIRNII